jgi:nitroreductase
MNPVIDAIKKRRSTRAYEQKPIPKNILEKIVEAGNQAPYTSMDRSQPWRFVVVEDAKFKQKLFQTAFPFWKNSIDGMKDKFPQVYLCHRSCWRWGSKLCPCL